MFWPIFLTEPVKFLRSLAIAPISSEEFLRLLRVSLKSPIVESKFLSVFLTWRIRIIKKTISVTIDMALIISNQFMTVTSPPISSMFIIMDS
jgi:hypothetical protein